MFKVLFIIVGLAAGWFCSVAGIALYSYTQLDRTTTAHMTTWKIVEYSPSKLAIEAFYTFSVEGKEWNGQIIFSKPYYLNRPSAEQAVAQKKQESWVVWYSHKNPTTSSLEKSFPYKKCFNALIVLGLLGYFWILKYRSSLMG